MNEDSYGNSSQSFVRVLAHPAVAKWYPAFETPGYYQVLLRNATHFTPESLGVR